MADSVGFTNSHYDYALRPALCFVCNIIAWFFCFVTQIFINTILYVVNMSCDFFVFEIIRDGRLLIDELTVRCILEMYKRYSFAIFGNFSQTLTFWVFPNSFRNFFVFEILKFYCFRTSLLFSELFPKP